MNDEALALFQRRFTQGLLAFGTDVEYASAGYRIHVRNVGISLACALADSFPVTARLVGEDCFAALAGSFVAAHPPTRGWLSGYGADFPDFVATYPPLQDVPYLADVARLEWARIVVAGAADEPGLDLNALAALEGEVLLGARLALHAGAVLLTTTFPIAEIWQAHQDSDVDAALAHTEFSGHARDILVVRSEAFEITHAQLSPWDGIFLRAIVNGAPLSVAWSEADRVLAGYDLTQGLLRLTGARALGNIANRNEAVSSLADRRR